MFITLKETKRTCAFIIAQLLFNVPHITEEDWSSDFFKFFLI
jgi:hypothetical protein